MKARAIDLGLEKAGLRDKLVDEERLVGEELTPGCVKSLEAVQTM